MKENSLLSIRNRIDKIDNEILFLLSKRLKLAVKVAEIKKIKRIPVMDKKREKELLTKLSQLASQKKMSEKFILKLFKTIITESKRVQRSVLTKTLKK